MVELKLSKDVKLVVNITEQMVKDFAECTEMAMREGLQEGKDCEECSLNVGMENTSICEVDMITQEIERRRSDATRNEP